MATLPYSMTLPPETGGKTRRIAPPAEITEFRTNILSYSNDGTGSTNWRLAWQDADTGLWNIDDFYRLATAEGSSQKRVLSGIFFFDALRHLADHEHLIKKSGAADVTSLMDDTTLTGITDWMAVADAAGQARDTENLPHPTVGGHILTHGESFFDDSAHELARANRQRPLLPPDRAKTDDFQNMLTAMVKSANLPATQISPAAQIKQADQILATKAFIDASNLKILSRLDDLRSRIEIMINTGFISPRRYRYTDKAYDGDADKYTLLPIVDAIVTIVTGGKFVDKPQYSRLQTFLPEHDFRLKASRAEKEINTHPDEKTRTLCLEFTKAARATMYFEKAAHLRRKALESGTGVRTIQKILAKGLAAVEAGGKAAGMPENDIVRLKLAFSQGTFSQTRTFLQNLDKKYEALKDMLPTALPS